MARDSASPSAEAKSVLSWEMKRRGAEVVAYDLSEQSQSWDLVPFGGSPDPTFAAERSFDVAGLEFHNQTYEGQPCPMYTLVGRRPDGGSRPASLA